MNWKFQAQHNAKPEEPHQAKSEASERWKSFRVWVDWYELVISWNLIRVQLRFSCLGIYFDHDDSVLYDLSMQ